MRKDDLIQKDGTIVKVFENDIEDIKNKKYPKENTNHIKKNLPIIDADAIFEFDV
jgi:hypothetical protein